MIKFNFNDVTVVHVVCATGDETTDPGYTTPKRNNESIVFYNFTLLTYIRQLHIWLYALREIVVKL